MQIKEIKYLIREVIKEIKWNRCGYWWPQAHWRDGRRTWLAIKSLQVWGDQSTVSTIISYIPGAHVIDPINAISLGSRFGYVLSISEFIDDKVLLLEKWSAKLQHFFAWSHTFSAVLILDSKRIYIMLSSPSFLSTSLKSFDDEVRSIVSGITNALFDFLETSNPPY